MLTSVPSVPNCSQLVCIDDEVIPDEDVILAEDQDSIKVIQPDNLSEWMENETI